VAGAEVSVEISVNPASVSRRQQLFGRKMCGTNRDRPSWGIDEFPSALAGSWFGSRAADRGGGIALCGSSLNRSIVT
jgi:hypothetical protein